MNATNSSAVLLDDLSTPVNGVIIMIICIITTIIYAPCAYVMATDIELKNNSCYQLMLQQALCDACNLLMNFYVGFIYTFNVTLPYWFNKLYFGTTFCMSWMVYLPLIQVIAFNRCLIIVFSHKPWSDVLFSKNASKIWMCLCFVDGTIWWMLMISPYCTAVYDEFLRTLLIEGPWTEHITTAFFIHTTVMIYGSAVCYLVTIGYLVATRNSLPGQSSQLQEMQKDERKLMKQAAIICLYPWFLDSYYYIFMIFGVPWNGVLYHYLWTLNSFINPLVFLTMNNTIRKKVRQMVVKDENTVQPFSIIPMINVIPVRPQKQE